MGVILWTELRLPVTHSGDGATTRSLIAQRVEISVHLGWPASLFEGPIHLDRADGAKAFFGWDAEEDLTTRTL